MECPNCKKMGYRTELIEDGQSLVCPTCGKSYRVRTEPPTVPQIPQQPMTQQAPPMQTAPTPTPPTQPQFPPGSMQDQDDDEPTTKKSKRGSKKSKEKPVNDDYDNDDDDDYYDPSQKKGIAGVFQLLAKVFVRNEGTKEEKKKARIIVIGVVAVIVAVVFLFTVLKPQKNDEPDTATLETETETEEDEDIDDTEEVEETEEEESEEPAVVEKETEKPVATESPAPIEVETEQAESKETEEEETETDVQVDLHEDQVIVEPEDLNNISAQMRIISFDGNTVVVDVFWKTYIPVDQVKAATVGSDIVASNGITYQVVSVDDMKDDLKMDNIPGFDMLTQRNDIVLMHENADSHDRKYYAIGKENAGYCTMHSMDSSDFASLYYVIAPAKQYGVSLEVKTVFSMVKEENMLISGIIENGILTVFNQT